MIPELFASALRQGSGPAAPTGAAWPAAAADAAAAETELANSLFADLLAATIAPQGNDAPAPAGASAGKPSSPWAAPAALPDLWLGLLAVDSPDSEFAEGTADETEPLPEEAAVEQDVPLTGAPIDAVDTVPVPILVQVPTDIVRTEIVAQATPNVSVETAAPNVSVDTKEVAAEPSTSSPVVAVEARASLPADIGRAVAPRENVEARSEAADREVADRLVPDRQAAGGPQASGSPAIPLARKPEGLRLPASEGLPASEPLNSEAPQVTPLNETASAADSTPQEAERSATVQDAHRSAALRALKAVVLGSQEQAERQAPAGEPVPASARPDVTAQIAQAAGAQSKAGETVARRAEAAPIDPRVTIAAEGVASVERSQEQGDLAQNNNTRQSSSAAAPRETAAARSLDVPASTGAFTLAMADPAARPVLQAATPLQLFTPAQEADNAARLVESMRVQWRQGIPEATVRLNPEHLGEVTISIRVERGAVSATIHAETPAVQEWLESQADRLRSGLADQGLSLERFVVQRERQQERRDQRQQPAPRYRQPQEEGPRFEITV